MQDIIIVGYLAIIDGVFALGIILLVITSISYFKKARMKPLQIVLGLLLIGSIFVLPVILPLKDGINVLIGHMSIFFNDRIT